MGADRQNSPRRKPTSDTKRTSAEQASDPKNVEQTHVLRILQSFRRIIRAVDLDSRQLITQYGITGPQLLCLSAVVETGQLSVAALARRVHLSPSTVVGILDRLEQKGLILRSRDGRDRRIVNIAPTLRGQQLVGQAPSPLHQTLRKALEGLTELEQATIALSVERVVDLIDAREIDAAPMLEGSSTITGAAEAPATVPDKQSEGKARSDTDPASNGKEQ